MRFFVRESVWEGLFTAEAQRQRRGSRSFSLCNSALALRLCGESFLPRKSVGFAPGHATAVLACCLIFVLLNISVPAQAVTAETRRLTFHVAPLFSKGDIAAQVQQGLQRFRQPIVHLRLLVVGIEQIPAARQAVRAHFTRRRQPLPALSVIAIGALPQPGARVAIEAVLQAAPNVNPTGLAFIAGQPATSEAQTDEMLPLIEKSLTALDTAHRAMQAKPEDVLRATCFVTALQDSARVTQQLRQAYPQAALSVAQLQRQPERSMVECETVVRARVAAAEPLRFINPAGLTASPNYSHIAFINARRVVFSGQHLAAGLTEAEARQAFTQLHQSLQAAGTSLKNVAMSSLYPATQAGSDLVRKIRFEFYDKARAPASTLLLFEGASPDGATKAAFALDVVAIKHE